MAFWDNIKFPYFTTQQLNLDWILTEIKRVMGFFPEDGNAGEVLMKTSTGTAWEEIEAIDININNLPQDTEIADTDKLIYYDISASANRKITPPDMLNSMMSNATPLMDGTGSAGTSKKPARYDHRHPSDTSKQNALSGTQLAACNSGITAAKVASHDACGSIVLLSPQTAANQHVIGTGATNTIQLNTNNITDYSSITLVLFVGSIEGANRCGITITITGTVSAVFPIASSSGVGWLRMEISTSGLITFITSSATDVYVNAIYGTRKGTTT
jgi:hypothetical protein